MRRLYRRLLAPAMLYSISSSSIYAEDINNFKLQAELLANGDVSLSSSINLESNTCLMLSYVQVLRNYESEIDTDIDGTPILSRWETLWENGAINQRNTNSPKVNVQKAKNRCIDRRNNNAPNNPWSFTLTQGSNHLGSEYFNESSLYEDATLKISAIYISKTTRRINTGSPFGMTTETQTTATHKVSTPVISLKPTKENLTQKATHNFKFPGYVRGRKMPLAYSAVDQNVGCLGRVMTNNQSGSSQPNEGENPALMHNSLSINSPKYECYFATQVAQKANQEPQVILKDRTVNDVLIMCPDSTIPDELSYNKFKADKINIPTSKGSPYLQVIADGNTRWCNYVEKAERKWTNLHSVSNEGWMVSLNKRTNKLECVAKNGECANTLYGNPNLKNMVNQPASLVRTPALALTGHATRSCQFKDGSSADCPDQFNETVHKSVNDLVQALQYESMRRSFH